MIYKSIFIILLIFIYNVNSINHILKAENQGWSLSVHKLKRSLHKHSTHRTNATNMNIYIGVGFFIRFERPLYWNGSKFDNNAHYNISEEKFVKNIQLFTDQFQLNLTHLYHTNHTNNDVYVYIPGISNDNNIEFIHWLSLFAENDFNNNQSNELNFLILLPISMTDGRYQLPKLASFRIYLSELFQDEELNTLSHGSIYFDEKFPPYLSEEVVIVDESVLQPYENTNDIKVNESEWSKPKGDEIRSQGLDDVYYMFIETNESSPDIKNAMKAGWNLAESWKMNGDDISFVEVDTHLKTAVSEHVATGFVFYSIVEGIFHKAMVHAEDGTEELMKEYLVPLVGDVMCGAPTDSRDPVRPMHSAFHQEPGIAGGNHQNRRLLSKPLSTTNNQQSNSNSNNNINNNNYIHSSVNELAQKLMSEDFDSKRDNDKSTGDKSDNTNNNSKDNNDNSNNSKNYNNIDNISKDSNGKDNKKNSKDNKNNNGEDNADEFNDLHRHQQEPNPSTDISMLQIASSLSKKSGESGVAMPYGALSIAITWDLLMFIPKLTEEITERYTSEIENEVHNAVVENIRADIEQFIPDTVTKIVRESVPQTLSVVVPTAVKRLLPPYLTNSLAVTLTHTLTRSLTHALTHTLQHSIIRDPKMEKNCYECKYFQKNCNLCSKGKDDHRQYQQQHYAHWYSAMYSDYYCDFFIHGEGNYLPSYHDYDPPTGTKYTGFPERPQIGGKPEGTVSFDTQSTSTTLGGQS